jgi:kynurenine formamidase
MGPGVFIPLSNCKLREVLAPHIFKEREVTKGDIVLVGNSPYTGPERPQIASESIEWLVTKRIKILGIDDSVRLGPRPPTGFPKSLKDMVDHDLCLSNEILLIEQLIHLDQIQKSRFFFIGLPISIVGMDSFPIRAVAIEDWPKDQWPEL